MKSSHLQPSFVEFIPETLVAGVLYVSMEFRTTAHLCCCGCESPVYLPLGRTQWKLTFDGEAISLHPSIGSWSLPCRSHYWIRGNRIIWAEQWSQERVDNGRMHDRMIREEYFAEQEFPGVPCTSNSSAESLSQPAPPCQLPVPSSRERSSLWNRIVSWTKWR